MRRPSNTTPNRKIMTSTILVTGTTGKIGTHLTNELLDDNAPFRVFVRNPDKASRLKAKGIDTAVGTFEDEAALNNAMRGIEKLVMLTPADRHLVMHQENIIKAALRNDVKHIVKISAIGTDLNASVALLRWHAEIEHLIKKLGINYTFLRPNLFIQNFLNQAPSIQHKNEFYTPVAHGRIAMIDVQDVALAVAKVLLSEGHTNRTYTLTGPQALSYEEIASLLSRLLMRPIFFTPISFDNAFRAMVSMGMPQWMASDLVGMSRMAENGNMEEVTPDLEQLTGSKGTTFEQFMLEHLAHFAASSLSADLNEVAVV
jgi:uncharacterized protein YbjT (DUF2867 family)